MIRYIVMTASAKMPSKVLAPYRRVGVVELTTDYADTAKRPTMLSKRAIGVRRVVKTWERCHARGRNTEYARAKAAAEALAARLNAESSQ